MTGNDDARRVAGHLVRALTSYELEARRDGFVVPPELPALRDFIVSLATARQDATPLGDPAPTRDGEGMETPLMTKREAASCLRLSTRTLERLISSGDLVSVQIGGRTLVRRVDLESYVDGLAPSGQSVPMTERIEGKSSA